MVNSGSDQQPILQPAVLIASSAAAAVARLVTHPRQSIEITLPSISFTGLTLHLYHRHLDQLTRSDYEFKPTSDLPVSLYVN